MTIVYIMRSHRLIGYTYYKTSYKTSVQRALPLEVKEMDTILYSVLRITVMVLILRTLFRLFAYPKTRSFPFINKQNSKEQAVTDKASQEPQPEAAPVEMVVDKIRGTKIPRHQSYIILDSDNKPVYFSTWDDRQEYINEMFG